MVSESGRVSEIPVHPDRFNRPAPWHRL